MIEFGVHAGQQDITWEEYRRLWRHCDESGFHWMSVWDHFYESPPIDGNHPAFEAVAAMAALAAETKNVRIGCLVFCMNYRNPALLAKSMTTIDQISNGRVSIGLGAGWHEQEHAGFGYNYPSVTERLDRLSEGARIIKAMMTHDRSSFEGQYYRIAEAANYPRPVQANVPIIIGGGGEQRTLRIAARRADGWNGAYFSPADYRHKCVVLDEWCERYNRDPKSIERSANVHFWMSSKADAVAPQSRQAGVFGKPQQVIDMIGEYVDAGAARFIVAIRPPIDWDALQSYIEDVMPAFN